MAHFNESLAWSEESFSNNYPVHRACRDGQPQELCERVQMYRNSVLQEDLFRGWTPGHWAAYFGKLDCLRIVVSASVPGNGVNMQTSRSNQSLAHCAAEAGHAHCLLWLLQAGANPNLKDLDGDTPLHKCARTGNAECVSLLVESSCDVRAMNNSGESASTVAEKNGFLSISSYIHQAELVRELGGKLPYSQSVGFNHNFRNGMRNVTFPNTNHIHLSRKRGYDDMNNNNQMKRIRFEAPFVETLPQNMDLTDNGTTASPCVPSSVIEHESMCNVEQGYANTFFHCMFSEFHGC